jgi:hypothetical protein
MAEPEGAVSAVPASVLAGTYECSDEGLTITLRIGADGRFEQRMTADEVLFDEDEGATPTERVTRGRWRFEDGALHLFDRPARAPEIKLIEARRDPAVRMRVEIREPDGKPARGLVVGEGEQANPRSAPDRGVVLVPLDYGWTPGLRRIVRAGDELALASFQVDEGGANSFRFVYRPSELEPFDERAAVVDGQASAIIVPVGISGAVLRRVR